MDTATALPPVYWEMSEIWTEHTRLAMLFPLWRLFFPAESSSKQQALWNFFTVISEDKKRRVWFLFTYNGPQQMLFEQNINFMSFKEKKSNLLLPSFHVFNLSVITNLLIVQFIFTISCLYFYFTSINMTNFII